jgi:hypothetical protein
MCKMSLLWNKIFNYDEMELHIPESKFLSPLSDSSIPE